MQFLRCYSKKTHAHFLFYYLNIFQKLHFMSFSRTARLASDQYGLLLQK